MQPRPRKPALQPQLSKRAKSSSRLKEIGKLTGTAAAAAAAAGGTKFDGGRGLGRIIPIHLVVREGIAVALYHLVQRAVLGPLCGHLHRIVYQQQQLQQQRRPYPLAISAVSLWWTFTVTGLLPLLTVRITESRLRRPNVPHPVLSIILNGICRSLAIYCATGVGPDLTILSSSSSLSLWQLITINLHMPLELLQMTALSVGILVVPTLLKVNRIQVPAWTWLLLLLVPSTNDNETNQSPDSQPVVHYLMMHLLAGLLAGRWMHMEFPR